MTKEYISSEYGTTFGSAEVDYITLTTFTAGAFYTLMNLVSEEEVHQQDRFRQYTGVRYGQLRFLEGIQQGREHFIVIGEGSSARWVIETASQERIGYHNVPIADYFKCTRLDVQVSAPDNHTHFRKLVDNLRNPLGKWRSRGKAPTVQLIEGTKTSKGLGKTIYVGSVAKKNGHFIRIYEKEGPHEQRYLRFEPQFKGEAAQYQYMKLWTGEARPEDIVVSVISKIPVDVVDNHLSHLREAVASGVKHRVAPKRQPNKAEKRVLWMKYHVAKALMNIDCDRALDWLWPELIKLAFVLRNKARMIRRRESYERAYKLWNAETEPMPQEVKIYSEYEAIQLIADAEIRVGENKEWEGLPEQQMLWSTEEYQKMLDVAYHTPATEYR